MPSLSPHLVSRSFPVPARLLDRHHRSRSASEPRWRLRHEMSVLMRRTLAEALSPRTTGVRSAIFRLGNRRPSPLMSGPVSGGGLATTSSSESPSARPETSSWTPIEPGSSPSSSRSRLSDCPEPKSKDLRTRSPASSRSERPTVRASLSTTPMATSVGIFRRTTLAAVRAVSRNDSPPPSHPYPASRNRVLRTRSRRPPALRRHTEDSDPWSERSAQRNARSRIAAPRPTPTAHDTSSVFPTAVRAAIAAWASEALSSGKVWPITGR